MDQASEMEKATTRNNTVITKEASDSVVESYVRALKQRDEALIVEDIDSLLDELE